MKIRIMTPAASPLDVKFSDLEVQIYEHGPATVLDIGKLAHLANENGLFAIDAHMLHRMLEKTDRYHSYQKIPVPKKEEA